MRRRRGADTISIPVALGEQESSHWHFHWCIRNRVVDIVQPDLILLWIRLTVSRLLEAGLFFDGGGKVCKLTVMGKKNKTTGLRPVKLMRVLLSNLAIERCAFRIPPADGT